ncbi:hypothetical protein [Mycolicibacterium sp.]|uniref:hypothetical protein n=1 Tax=Mycolicibacterium sp. TaxID=2320850 RepID=UPI0028B25AB8|nr:hypothetical protein [Mycolicibacterium sp.]
MRTRAPHILVLGVAAAALSVSGCSALDQATSASPSPATQSRGDSNPLSGSPATSVAQWVAGPRGMSATVPPGRYQVRLTDGAQAGSWMACDTTPCDPSQAAATALGNQVGGFSSTIDIRPGTQNLLLTNVILTATEEPGIRR